MLSKKHHKKNSRKSELKSDHKATIKCEGEFVFIK